MNAVDTNVLLYVHDPRDPAKQAKAASLVTSLTDAVLLWQVACEYLAASRKLAPFGFRQEEAWRELDRLRIVWAGALPDWIHLQAAEAIIASRSVSFWDALILAVAQEAGVTTLYSEDLAGVVPPPGLNVVNPFV
jgi:predicted nucleic acid-binding protein